MLFKCAKGMFLLQRNYRNAFNLEAFVEKYIEECFDKSAYVVGDISSNILRLKGFDTDPKSPNYFGFIDDYLELSCVFGCPFFVVKKVKSEEEYKHLQKSKKATEVDESGIVITPIVKENFDKESLVLKSSPKGKANIVIDSKRINEIPKGQLPDDLKEFIKQDSVTSTVSKPEEPVETQTYVSASPDFDPSKKENFKKNNNKNKNNNQNRKHHKNKKNNDSDKK